MFFFVFFFFTLSVQSLQNLIESICYFRETAILKNFKENIIIKTTIW